jgi:hypothetical protein
MGRVRNRAGTALVLCWLLGGAAVVGGASGVRVVDENGAAIAGARWTVLLRPRKESPLYEQRLRLAGRTDAEGIAAFVPSAAAILLVDAPGFAPLRRDLTGEEARRPVVLDRGVTLSGRLEAPREETAGAGEVCALWEPLPDLRPPEQPFARCAAVAEDGTWSIEAAPPGTVTLTWEIAGFLPGRVESVPTERAFQHVLAPGNRTRVRLERGGYPVAGARLACDGAVAVETGGDGTALLAIPGKSARCEAFGPNGELLGTGAVRAPTAELQRFQLAPAGEVRGRIVGEDGTVPLDPGFRWIEQFADGSGSVPRPWRGRFAVDGTFQQSIREGARRLLEIRADGWLPYRSPWLDLGPEQAIDLGVVILRRGAGVRGLLLGREDGAPVAGAQIELVPAGRKLLVSSREDRSVALSDAEGAFVAAGVPPGRYLLSVSGRGEPPTYLELDLDEEEVLELGTLWVGAAVQLRGEVVAREGSDERPVAGARVEIVAGLVRDAEVVAETATDGAGRFGPLALAPGSYRAMVRQERLLADQELEVREGKARQEVRIGVEQLRLRGRVVEDGVPVTGGELHVKPVLDLNSSLGIVLRRHASGQGEQWAGRPEPPWATEVAADGGFELSGLRSGLLDATYYGWEGETVVRRFELSESASGALQLEIGGGRIEGAVVVLGDRSAVSATVQLLDREGRLLTSTVSDSEGRFQLAGIAPGSYQLFATTPEAISEAPLAVSLAGTNGGDMSQVVLELAEGQAGTLDIVATARASKAQMPLLPLSLIDRSGRALYALPTDRGGEAHWTMIPPGHFVVAWADDLLGTGVTPAFRLDRFGRRLELSIERGRDLVVRCVGPRCAGAALPWFGLRARDGADLGPRLLRSSAIRFSEEGIATVGRLAPGVYTVETLLNGQRSETKLEVGEGPGTVELALTVR